MIVLDTHAWIWHVSAPARLSARARKAVAEADVLGICTISCLELATLVRKGRIALDRDVRAWVAHALDRPRTATLDLSPEIAVAAGSLAADFPGDPADRILYATARALRARLVTRDDLLHRYDRRLTLW